MPDRIVRASILTSDRVNQVSWAGEVFYRRLMNVVDDYGRYDGRPAILRAVLYPLKISHVSDSDIGKWTRECADAALVRQYTVDSKPYLELLRFGQKIRTNKSKWPDPPTSADSCEQMLANASVVVDVESMRPPPAGGSRKVSIPKDFAISDRVIAWAEQRGIRNLPRHFEFFVSKAKAKNYKYADWDEALMGAVRDDWAKIGTGEKKVALG